MNDNCIWPFISICHYSSVNNKENLDQETKQLNQLIQKFRIDCNDLMLENMTLPSDESVNQFRQLIDPMMTTNEEGDGQY